MKKSLIMIGLIAIFILLDNTIAPLIAVEGYYPSFVFVFVICYSIIQGENDALKVGIFSGVMQDIYFFNGFGINCITNLLVCILAAYIGKNIFKDKKLIPIASVFALTFLKSTLIYVLLFIFKIYINPYKIIFISLYNMVVSILMYHYVYRLCSKSYMVKEWKF